MSADDLQVAVALHQAGRLGEAVAVYDRILAGHPNQAEALHLRGLAALQQGDPRRSIELMSRAATLRPTAAAIHCNLAEAYRQTGDAVRAEECARSALRLQPVYPEAANNLGLAMQAQGRLAEATDQFRAAVAANPRLASAHNNLANALRLANDKTGALAHFRLAAELQPQAAEAHSNLGQMCLEMRLLDEALIHCRRAVELRPNVAEALSNLGNVLREHGQLAEAKRCYLRALELKPNLAMVRNNLGQALQEEGDVETAIRWYREALAQEPRSARFLANLASALGDQEKLTEAEECYRTALRNDADHAPAHAGLGHALQQQGKLDEAQTHLSQALRLDPDLARAHFHLGNLFEQRGRLAAAEASFREALRLSPDFTAAHGQLATLLRDKLPDDDFQRLRSQLNAPRVGEVGRAALHFGLAQVCDAKREYAAAADHLRQANELNRAGLLLRGRGYEADDHTKFVNNVIASCSAELFERTRGQGSESRRPIFIFGLPRSGTTLTEQILASHSQVFGAGELRLARQAFEGLPAALDSSNPPFACLLRLDRAAIRRLAQNHLDALANLDEHSPRVVDKMPDNYLYLGLLQILFPRGRFIHVRRDVRDTAVSCWMTNFAQIRWASDPGHVARRFAEYLRLMDHWRAVLPLPILEIDYEQTVADLEGVARRIVDWCGLEWEDECLAFHLSERPVRTASLMQVRQPIYNRSVQRWRNYSGTALEPLLSAVEEHCITGRCESAT